MFYKLWTARWRNQFSGCVWPTFLKDGIEGILDDKGKKILFLMFWFQKYILFIKLRYMLLTVVIVKKFEIHCFKETLPSA